MLSFRNLPLRRKQTLIMMLTSAITLLLACVAFLGVEAFNFRGELFDEISTMSQIAGNNCAAALDFNDLKAAEDTLGALRAKPPIATACVYNRRGEVFAVYQRDGKSTITTFPPARPAGHEFHDNQLQLFLPITVQGEKVGTIYVACDLYELKDRLRHSAVVALLVLGVSLAAAFSLATRLQRVISGPVLQLAQAVRMVALEKDYSVRAAKQTNDELGQLVDGFNEMLAQIQQRDAALQSARGQLELRVVERTAELANTNKALSESNEKFRQLAENITDVFWMTSPDLQKVLYASPAYEQVWGRPVASLYAHPNERADAILPEEREHVFATFSRLTADEPSVRVEFRIARPDGTVRWIFSRGFQVLDATGKLIRLAGIDIDITERKQAEEELRLLSSAVEQSKESIIITDAELNLPGPRIIFVNPAFTRMTGYSAEEALGKTPRMLQGPRTDRAVLDRLRQNLERGEAFEGEAINYRKDGREFNLEWQIAPIRNPGGKIAHFVAIQHDISERKRLEAQLFQSQKMETVGKLAGGIAHEFNSILTAIIGQSELLLGDLPTGSPLAKNANEISKAAGRAATLTRQLLAYGRKQILQPEILDLNSVLAGMENTLRHLMGRDVDVRIVPAAGLKAVKADAGQIEQVIMNMAINARDAMPNGGKLTLETANVTLDEQSVGSYPELKPGDYVMLAITDTGAGMNAEVRARVFEPFFSTKDVGQGTGLGLSTCYGIIKQSGGHIGAYSELARGAAFKIYLPQVEPQAKISPRRLDPPDLPRGTETILLVEDDPALREMAATLLRRLGYVVLAAADGIEALTLKQQRRTGHVDLLFTDVVMPHMSGKELADRVQAIYPHTRILFTSAYTENAVVHQGVLDKDVALLQKPFTPSALAHKLREVLDDQSLPKPDVTQSTFGFTETQMG